MKMEWRKFFVRLLLISTLVCMAVCAVNVSLAAGSAGLNDSEASLRQSLGNAMHSGNYGYSAYQTENLKLFEYGDYDGDGIREAFAFVCIDENDFTSTMTGDIWFVSPGCCEPVQRGLSYYDLRKLGSSAPLVFTAEEGYGGSGSTSHLWSVINSTPVAVQAGVLAGLEYGDGNEFYAYPDAFDGYSDNTGHTWKQYYFFLDGTELREYGGIYITMDQLRMFDGAEAIVRREESQGKRLVDIIYRTNGIINLNFQETGSNFLKANTNVTLRYEGVRASLWKEDMGVYELASNPAIAVYPDAFIAPGGSSADFSANWTTPTATLAPFAPMPTARSTAASAPNAAASGQLVQATGDVNVRSSPSLTASKLGTLRAGESCKYLGESKKDDRGVVWYKLSFRGQQGWVSSKYAALRQGSSSGSSSSSSSSSGSSSSSSSGKKVRIVGGKANIRSGPGLNYKTVGSLKEGRVVEYLGKTSKDSRGVNWYYINFQGTIGWVSSKYGKLS